MMMKYITLLLLSVFLIPFVQNVDAQSVLGPTSGGLGGGIKNIPSGGGQISNDTTGPAGQSGQSMNNTSQQAGQASQNTTGQSGQSAPNATSQNNSTSGGNPIMDMLGKIIPGQ